MSPPTPDGRLPTDRTLNDDDERVSRPIRPLGTARHPARSTTPTPSNPHGTPPPTPLYPRGSTGPEHAPSKPAFRSVREMALAAIGPPLDPASLRSRLAAYRPWYPFPLDDLGTPNNLPLAPSGAVAAIPANFDRLDARRISNTSTSSTDTAASSTSARFSEVAISPPTGVLPLPLPLPLSRLASWSATSDSARRSFSAEPEELTSRATRLPPRGASGLGNMTTAHADQHPVAGPSRSHESEHALEHGRNSLGSSNGNEEEKERAHFQNVLRAFNAYLPHSLAANNARRKSFYSLARSHRLLLSQVGPELPGPLVEMENEEGHDSSVHDADSAVRGGRAQESAGHERQTLPPGGRGFKSRLDEIDDRIRRNADVLSLIVEDSRGFLDDARADGAEANASAVSEKTSAAAASVEKSAQGHVEPQGDAALKLQTADPPGAAVPRDIVRTVPQSEGSSSSSLRPAEEQALKRQRRRTPLDAPRHTNLGTSIDSTSGRSNVGSAEGSSGSSGSLRDDPSAASFSREGAEKSRQRPSSRGASSRTSEHEIDKIRSTIKQLVRDWSDEGAQEREAAYGPILDALDARFGEVPSTSRNQVRVLVPGAGLGRLAFEIAWQGYSSQGNEYSFFMLLASHWILNKSSGRHAHTVYPYVHSSSNWRKASDMLQGIRIPDVNPTDLPPHVDFSMVAGEFVDVYSKEQEIGGWDAVATVYFVDTARNIVKYLEVINHLLPIGGFWCNVGPLLWHFENNGDLSIELTLEEVMDLIQLMGFEIEEHRTLESQPYTGNARSMLSYEYTPEFWVARKVKEAPPGSEVAGTNPTD
ncbi:Putative trehalase [Ceraceosorus bombacis]|uniref:carnosine N-methyltransferase n=1 Tax=Ceraceosorus bombacis TaxID=401625 RepID=A0A0P1BMN2_9BASI|nr:Putative trehalase [Ceraceosorus bombacis]